jgi:carbon monoxide dehydrogenase subunit G
MELSSTRIIAAPRDRVWQALNDPQTLKASVPGCESLERVDDDTFRAAVAAKVGPVSAKFNGKLQLLDVDPPNGYRLKFEGQGGGAGFANGEARVSLTDAPDHQTSLSYAVKATVGGKLAQIGNRLVDSAAKKLADDFFARFAAEVGKAPVAEIATQAPAVTPAVPRGGARWVRVLAIGIIVAIVIYLYSRGAP